MTSSGCFSPVKVSVLMDLKDVHWAGDGGASQLDDCGSNARFDFGDRHSDDVLLDGAVVSMVSLFWLLCFRMNFKGFILEVRRTSGDEGRDEASCFCRISNFLGIFVKVGTLPRGLLLCFEVFFVESIKFSTVAFKELERARPNSS